MRPVVHRSLLIVVSVALWRWLSAHLVLRAVPSVPADPLFGRSRRHADRPGGAALAVADHLRPVPVAHQNPPPEGGRTPGRHRLHPHMKRRRAAVAFSDSILYLFGCFVSSSLISLSLRTLARNYTRISLYPAFIRLETNQYDGP